MPLHNVLIAVEPPSLERLIQHVLEGESGLRLVSCPSRSFSQGSSRSHSVPNVDVIVVNHRLQRKQSGDVLKDLKRACPASTLILLTPFLAGPTPPQGVDVCLPEEAVVKGLLPMIRKAALRAVDRTPLPAHSGPRT